MSRITRRAALALAAALFVTPILAHSTGELAELLGDREMYFEAFDRHPPAFTLSDAGGRTYDLEVFRGKVVVLNFVYASCPDVCPLHAEKIAEVQELVNQAPMKDLVQFVSITSDPANDTPGVLRAYGPAHGLDAANWIFLTTTPDQPEDTTRKLVEAFGHRFDPTGTGTQIHGVVTHVIDMTGRWRAKLPRPEVRPDEHGAVPQRPDERLRQAARRERTRVLGQHQGRFRLNRAGPRRRCSRSGLDGALGSRCRRRLAHLATRPWWPGHEAVVGAARSEFSMVAGLLLGSPDRPRARRRPCSPCYDPRVHRRGPPV